MTHNQRTIKALRERGLCADLVERYEHHGRRRHDCFGFVDVIAAGASGPLRLVQACASDRFADHERTLLANESAQVLALNWRSISIEIWSWRKKDGAWRARVYEYSGDNWQAKKGTRA